MIISRTTVPDLANFLNAELGRTNYRDLEEKTGVSRGSLENIIKRKNTKLPELETLQKIARGFNLPLWQVVEMAGVSLNLPQSPQDRIQRLVAVAEQNPNLERLVNRLIDMAPTRSDYVDGVLAMLEASLARDDLRRDAS